MLRYRGAVYKQALNLMEVPDYAIKEFLGNYTSWYTNNCVIGEVPEDADQIFSTFFHDASDYAYVEAIQRLYDSLVESQKPWFVEVARQMEDLDLTKMSAREDSFTGWLLNIPLPKDVSEGTRYGIYTNFLGFKREECAKEGRKDAERRLQQILRQYEKVDGKPCYRLIRYPYWDSPERHLDNLGIYWTTCKDCAGIFWYQRGRYRRYADWLVVARIDAEAVDFSGTLGISLGPHPSGSPEELREIRMQRHADIYVYGAVRIYDYRVGRPLKAQSYSIGEKIILNKWGGTGGGR